jgi:hypothetical protein
MKTTLLIHYCADIVDKNGKPTGITDGNATIDLEYSSHEEYKKSYLLAYQEFNTKLAQQFGRVSIKSLNCIHSFTTNF